MLQSPTLESVILHRKTVVDIDDREAAMNDLCTLAHYREDDLSAHAVSMAVMAWVLRHANANGSALDRAAFHRAADLALVLFREEERRFASADASAPLLDALYLKAFVPEPGEVYESEGCDEEQEERAEEQAAKAIAARFQREILRRVHQRPMEAPVGCEELAR